MGPPDPEMERAPRPGRPAFHPEICTTSNAEYADRPHPGQGLLDRITRKIRAVWWLCCDVAHFLGALVAGLPK